MRFILVAQLILFSCFAYAGQKIVFKESALVYSGPSQTFRPLRTVKEGDSFPLATQRSLSPDGEEFYKILIKTKRGQKRVGFVPISVTAEVDQVDGEESLDEYKSFALAESAFQIAFHGFQNTNYLWTVGYLKYPAESFYLKGVVGQLLNKKSGSLALGGEVGLDEPFSDQFSIYSSFGLGLIFIPEENVIYAGSKNTNAYMQGGFGVRYNADQTASMGLGLFQMAVFSANNSFLSPGLSLLLEVGL